MLQPVSSGVLGAASPFFRPPRSSLSALCVCLWLRRRTPGSSPSLSGLWRRPPGSVSAPCTGAPLRHPAPPLPLRVGPRGPWVLGFLPHRGPHPDPARSPQRRRGPPRDSPAHPCLQLQPRCPHDTCRCRPVARLRPGHPPLVWALPAGVRCASILLPLWSRSQSG